MEKQKNAVINANFSFDESEPIVQVVEAVVKAPDATLPELTKPVIKKKTEKVLEEAAKDEDREDSN
jgi:hypothetical protein